MVLSYPQNRLFARFYLPPRGLPSCGFPIKLKRNLLHCKKWKILKEYLLFLFRSLLLNNRRQNQEFLPYKRYLHPDSERVEFH